MVRWRPVVYGRTLRADQWWRVRPLDWDAGWLNDVVLEVVRGGEDIAASPRLALARAGDRLLVGGVAMASQLNPDLAVARDNRPLYAFVGWACDQGETVVPPFALAERSWTRWAAEVYTQWMLPDWQRHANELRGANQAPAIVPPWGSLAGRSNLSPADDPWAMAMRRAGPFVLCAQRDGSGLVVTENSGAALQRGAAVPASSPPPEVRIPAPAATPAAEPPAGFQDAPPRLPSRDPYGPDPYGQWRPPASRPAEKRTGLQHPGGLMRRVSNFIRDAVPPAQPPVEPGPSAKPAHGAAKDLQSWKDSSLAEQDPRQHRGPTK